MAYEFTDATFQTEVIDNNKVVEDLSKEYEGKAVIGKLNVDDNPEVPFNYNVRGIPTFLLFKNGELKDKIVGAQTKEYLKARIESLL